MKARFWVILGSLFIVTGLAAAALQIWYVHQTLEATRADPARISGNFTAGWGFIAIGLILLGIGWVNARKTGL